MKRERDEQDDEASSGDEIGPMPVQETQIVRKKRKVLPHEKIYLDHLPSADQYYKSFMHRETVNFVVATRTEFIITASTDGHVKFWKKQEVGIEFVKHYHAHLAPIVGVTASADGASFASVAADGSCKVFDVVNFDLINMLELDFTPAACCWVHKRGQARTLLAVTEKGTGKIRIFDGRGTKEPLHVVEKLHKTTVHVLAYADVYDTVISADESGFLEYWQPSEPFELPAVPGMWSYKSNTDLYEFKKTRTAPTSITISPNQSHFVTLTASDRQIRVFDLLSGKKTRVYDESLQAIQDMQQAGTAVYKVEDMEFGRRLAVEREIEEDEVASRSMNAVWDESSNFILYPTLLGIKVVNIVSNKVVRILGKEESTRWLNLSLYQGAPAKKGLTTAAMAASANPLLAERGVRDPTLFCTAYKKNRFYMFTRSEPEGERDIFNERPTREEQTIAQTTGAGSGRGPSRLARNAVVHTTMGDIFIKLFPEQAPKAVENFVGHARSGYFEGVLFHRVIAKFMIQTGDPLGDGTGGESIWGHDFEDEFSDELKHDRPYTVSMANPGRPNCNGSQWFITTTATPWLDKKHTIFGRAVAGLEVIHNIENVKTTRSDKPMEDIKIINISIE
ncbi:Peptidyl-prolyl cis-trans isomerase cyp15 Short=PPIase cyp15; AltName: Full=Cyclophilin cyp15; AltName: Full=Rotamase cyp15 [Serendipita indica DSM 11827]|nr:Peptidyl-prolyl cis-trans isomerase cyp15 Short=PPIase cyp15; AltName: Full=Cyclophilin cyp15; AltName: Full=Rotamase cyp15 [Serendipita indica DSM 11827]